MEFGNLFSQYWFNVLTAVGIIGGLYNNRSVAQLEIKTRRITNFLLLTQNHQTLWLYYGEHPNLFRILDPLADLLSKPVTPEEEVFVNMAIQLLSSAYRTMINDLTVKPDGLQRDINSFFSKPIPKAVWKGMRDFQDADFLKFVESCAN